MKKTDNLNDWDSIPDLTKILVIGGVTAGSVAIDSAYSALKASVGAVALTYMGWTTAAGSAIASASTVAAAAAAGTATVVAPLAVLSLAAWAITGTSPSSPNETPSMLQKGAFAAFCAAIGGVEIGLAGTEIAYTAAAAAIGLPTLIVLMGLVASGCVLSVAAGAIVIGGTSLLIESASNKVRDIFSSGGECIASGARSISSTLFPKKVDSVEMKPMSATYDYC